MRTLVTGGTGLVGNNCIRLLLERGHQVRVLSRTTSDARPLAGLDIEIAQGDVRDAGSLQAATGGVDWVVHAAAVVQLGWSGLELQQAINVEGTRNVARAARDVGARMVHVSSVDALGLGTRTNPATEEAALSGHVECPYVVTKRAAEQAL
ncbi:MAG: NAD-dependent epimerase/dehydratase family protein, partial [Pirellulales bacterium]